MRIEEACYVGLECIGKLLPKENMEKLWEIRKSVEKVIVFYAIEDDETIGYALYVDVSSMDATACLYYVEVEKEHRNQSVGSALIIRSYDEMRRKGYKFMYAVSYENDRQVTDDLLSRTGFSYSLCEKNYIYSRSDIEKSTMYNKLDDLKPLIKMVHNVKNMSAEQLEAFDAFLRSDMRSEDEYIGKYADISQINSQYSFCFINGGAVLGYMILERTDDTFYLIDGYAVKDPNAKFAVPAMLAFLIQQLSEEDVEWKISLSYGSKQIEDAAELVLGKSYRIENMYYWEKRSSI